MNNIPIHRVVHVLLSTVILFCSVFLQACSDDDTPEQQIHNFIAAGIDAAEARDLGDFKALIADDYRDVHGHDKRTMVRMAAGYFLQNKNIHLFTQIRNIHFPYENQADVQMYVAMTGQAINDISTIFNLRADLYLFELKLVKRDGDWLLSNARWKRVQRVDVTGV